MTRRLLTAQGASPRSRRLTRDPVEAGFGGYPRKCAGVAQSVRAPACHAGGRGFESRHSRHPPETPPPGSSFWNRRRWDISAIL
jgi:hypothetical protein